MSKLPIICIMGPTASGKTALAIDLLNYFPGEIISVDSALVYRGMDKGTAKPTATELQTAPHHLLDIRDPSQAYSAADFCQDATRLIADIQSRNRIPFLVGGTMLYFKALQQGLAALPAADATIRDALNEELKRHGSAYLHQRLMDVDPQSAARIHPNDPQRLQRALEVFLSTGQAISNFYQKETLFGQNDMINIGLMPNDRSLLHARIAQRFQQMMDQGFMDEMQGLFARKDLQADLPAMRAVGYRQAWAYLEGAYDLATMQEKAIVATRQLAKRQMTWLRHWPTIHLFDCFAENVTEQVKNFLQNLDE